MIRSIIHSIILFFIFGCISAHEIENVSVAKIVQVHNEIHVQIKISTEYLTHTVLGMDPEVSFHDYIKKPFDPTILVPVKNYVTKNFSIAVNGNMLEHNNFSMQWIENTKYSHDARITINIIYTLTEIPAIKQLTIKNALLIQTIPDQENTANITMGEKTNTLLFVKGKEVQTVAY